MRDEEIARRAAHLRSLSGLTTPRLARIFGVSRQTYHNWLRGEVPRERQRIHFFAIVGLIDEAAQRFPDSTQLQHWLLTPVSPGGKIPLDFLQTQQYNTFRGFLLRRPVETWPRVRVSALDSRLEWEFGPAWREDVE